MTKNDDVEKVARFQAALNQLIERIAEDRYVLAVVLVGSLSTETIWHREIARAVDHRGRRRQPAPAERWQGRTHLPHPGRKRHQHSRRGDSAQPVQEDGRRGVADGVFLQFLRQRQIVYSKDPSIESWFKKANSVATKDQERELLTFSTWTIHAHRHARKRLDIKGDLELAAQEIVGGRPQRGAHRNHPAGPGVRTGCHLPGDGRRPGSVSDDLSRRAGQAQESARAVGGAGRDRRVSRRALPGPPEAAARLSQEAEPSRAAVGDQRSLRVLAVAPVASGIGLRMAGAQRAAAKTLRSVQADEAQPGTGRRAGVSSSTV